ncbi:MAG: isoprenylcysteine carboxylmethyltransferase family protein [Anaerolineales bacterium]|nr:MAG: isoprenylcysteine carboxylmethyltransferase family protein [Anaerolineales bacterium]
MNRFTKWAEREFGMGERVIATLLAGVVFVVLIPFVILKESAAIDRWLHISRFDFGLINLVVGGAMALIGWLFAMWSIVDQLTRGRGTPLPVMATQTLLITGPFAYCRNPMSFGTIVLYSGLAIWAGSWSAIVLVTSFAAVLIAYLKTIEEKELEARFGQSYMEYKETTPFIIPSMPKK